MKITKGIKLRLYPKPEQEELLAQMFGNDRKVWNLMLAMANQRYENNPSSQFLNNYQMDYLMKRLKVELPYLKQSDSSSFQVVTHNLYQSFKMLFKHRAGHPRFHSRKSTKKSYSGKSKIDIVAKRYLKLPKLGYIKSSKTSRLLNGKIKRYTVTLTPGHHYELSVILECESQVFEKTGKKVGLDLGLSDLIITSDQNKFAKFTTKHLDYKAKLWQRKFDRRKNQANINVRQWNHNHKNLPEESIEDYSNWQRAKIHKARLQRTTKNKREAYLHRLTTNLVKNYDVIVMENLNVKGMMKNHSLADSIAHVCWRKIRDMLKYKCEWYGKQLIIVNPRNTSRICHKCGRKQSQFDQLDTNQWLNTREWTCQYCHVHQDRDINAAINILNRGLKTIN